MPKRTKVEAAKAKFEAAKVLSEVGSSVAGPIGGTTGGLAGLILGDQEIVFPMDCVAIPAFMFSALIGERSLGLPFMIYIKEGEVLNQVIPTDAQEAEAVVDSKPNLAQPKKRRKSPYKRAYSKAFEAIKPDYLKANGQWKKGGFKRAVKKAHAMAKEAMK